jgi:tRNA(fMet)-specific endonuclease VapC
MYILDTEHLTLLQMGGAQSLKLQLKLGAVPADQIATTIINYEEQMRGWLSRAAQAKTTVRLISAYAHLQTHIETFSAIPIVPFDQKAADEYERLKKLRLRVGAMDLKIAAVALANQATVLTRNLSDFNKVPGLRIEDWSV